MADPAEIGAAPRMQRRIKWLLIGSLAMNVLVAGLVIGAVIKGPPDGGRRDMGRDMGFGVFNEALTHEDRAWLKDAFRKSAPRREDMKRMMATDVAAILAALRAEPFDPAALDAALAVQKSRMEQRMALGQTLLRDRLAGMPAAERQAFADRLESSLAHFANRKAPPTQP